MTFKITQEEKRWIEARRKQAGWLEDVKSMVEGGAGFYDTNIDLTTANMLVTVYNALGDSNKERFEQMSLEQAVGIGWKLIK